MLQARPLSLQALKERQVMLQILQKRPLPLQEHQLALQALQEGQLPLQAPLHTLKECQLPLPRKIAPTPSPTGTLALATVPTETTADPATGPSGASSQEHCGKCKNYTLIVIATSAKLLNVTAPQIFVPLTAIKTGEICGAITLSFCNRNL